MRCIDADALKESYCKDCSFYGYVLGCEDECVACKNVNKAPTINVQPVVHAEFHCVNEDANVYMCTNCGGEWFLEAGTPEENDMEWCSFCGARMDKE